MTFSKRFVPSAGISGPWAGYCSQKELADELLVLVFLFIFMGFIDCKKNIF